MGNTSFFLDNTATGSEVRFDTLDDAFAAITRHVHDGEHWVIFEFDHSRNAGPAHLVAHGCGLNR